MKDFEETEANKMEKKYSNIYPFCPKCGHKDWNNSFALLDEYKICGCGYTILHDGPGMPQFSNFYIAKWNGDGHEDGKHWLIEDLFSAAQELEPDAEGKYHIAYENEELRNRTSRQEYFLREEIDSLIDFISGCGGDSIDAAIDCNPDIDQILLGAKDIKGWMPYMLYIHLKGAISTDYAKIGKIG